MSFVYNKWFQNLNKSKRKFFVKILPKQIVDILPYHFEDNEATSISPCHDDILNIVKKVSVG